MAPRVAALLLAVPTLAIADDTPPDGAGEIIEIVDDAPRETEAITYELSADEIRAVPGAANDVLRAATVLPGVARIPYSFGGLVLRGASPRDSAVYLDGIEVPIAFHFGGVTSFYPSGMLDELAVQNGGFDASFGRAQGGIVSLTTREPRTDRYRVGGSVGLLDSSAHAEGPLGSGGFLVGIRRSYLDALASPLVDDTTPLPSYWDFQLRTAFGDPRGSGRIAPMVFGSVDRIASKDLSITSAFVRAAAPFTRQWPDSTTLRVVPWLGFDQTGLHERSTYALEDEPERLHEHRFSRPVVRGGLRTEVTRDRAWGHLRGGFELEGGHLGIASSSTDEHNDFEMLGKSSIGWANLAAFAESRFTLDRYSFKPGLRLERFGLTRETVLDPRLDLAQRITDRVQLRQSIGRYHQPPTPADLDREFGNPDLKASYTDQVSAGIDIALAPTTLASITGFYSRGRRQGIVSREAGSIGGIDATMELLLEKQLGVAQHRENRGRSRSYGVELALRHQSGPWLALLGYTLAKSERLDDWNRGDSMHPDFVHAWRPFELDQRHDLQLAVSRSVGNWRFGARAQLVTGNPYSPRESVTYTDENGIEIFDLVTDPWAGRLPLFFSLDLRVDRTWQRSWGDVVWFLDIQNATWHRNVEARDYNPDPMPGAPAEIDVLGLPILPLTGVEFRPRD